MLDALNRSLVGWLKDGWRVHIDGIGYFDVSLTAPETRNPKDTKASSVKFKNVNFRADSYIGYDYIYDANNICNACNNNQ